MNVWLAVPPTVDSELNPKSLVNANVLSPPTVFFTIWMDAEQTGVAMAFVSKVTAPSLARRRPFTEAPLVAVIDDRARMFPWKMEYVPSVAELPTCQNTLQA